MSHTLARALVLACLLAFAAIRLLFRRAKGPREQLRPRRERLLTRTMTVAVVLPALGWLGSPAEAWGDVPLPPALPWLGLLLAIAGLAGLAWSHATLGREFSPWLELLTEHRLVTSGPYRWVRHPMYTAGLVQTVGCGLLAENVLVLGFPLLALGALILVRLPDEERMLHARFGPTWEAWAQRTGRLLPRFEGWTTRPSPGPGPQG
ncbi:MAG: isoprenylcysteine carboxylmethyltransferase family protein [Pseudomonadota bacterium]